METASVPFECGLRFRTDLLFSPEDQQRFADISGDKNPLHLDQNYAAEKGFPRPVVYGGLIVARISEIIGMKLPGPIGIWDGLNINFRQPLYVDESGFLEVELTQVSEATHSVVMKLTVKAGEKLVATGKASATLL